MRARTGILIYGLACYAVFLVVLAYAVGFIGNLWRSFGWTSLPSMDFGGPPAPLGEAVLVDALLLALFAVQHSVMARPGFKRWWTRIVPAPAERSSYVLASSLLLALLFWRWRPIATTLVWSATSGPAQAALVCLSYLGWLIAVVSTFLLDHLEFFGLRQVWNAYQGRRAPDSGFRTPLFYKAVRHPLYVGFIIAFWSTTYMTVGHLVFAAGLTLYILVAIPLEERDLVAHFGETYRAYQRRVRALLPKVGGGK